MTYSVRAPGPPGVTDVSLRCGRCNKLLAERVTRPWRIRCVRCGHTNISPKGEVRWAPHHDAALPTVDSPEIPMVF